MDVVMLSNTNYLLYGMAQKGVEGLGGHGTPLLERVFSSTTLLISGERL